MRSYIKIVLNPRSSPSVPVWAHRSKSYLLPHKLAVRNWSTMKQNSTSNNEKTFKESLEELYGQSVSEQEAFNAQVDLAELLRVLDEIDRALPQQDVHGKLED